MSCNVMSRALFPILLTRHMCAPLVPPYTYRTLTFFRVCFCFCSVCTRGAMLAHDFSTTGTAAPSSLQSSKLRRYCEISHVRGEIVQDSERDEPTCIAQATRGIIYKSGQIFDDITNHAIPFIGRRYLLSLLPPFPPQSSPH